MKLRAYLDTNGLNHTQFAALIGVSKTTVGRWLSSNGRVERPRWHQLAKIKLVTDGAVTADDFMPEDVPERDAPKVA